MAKAKQAEEEAKQAEEEAKAVSVVLLCRRGEDLPNSKITVSKDQAKALIDNGFAKKA